MSRHAASVKNLAGHMILGGDNVPPLVEIGLTDPPKSGGASHFVACLMSNFRDTYSEGVKGQVTSVKIPTWNLKNKNNCENILRCIR